MSAWGLLLGLTAEAAHYEALLQSDGAAGAPSAPAAVLPDSDSVAQKRRRFDELGLRLGVGSSLVNASFLTALYTEVDAADRMAIGGEVGLSSWGLLAGGYVRLRPVIWGGRARRALHAITLDAGYRYM